MSPSVTICRDATTFAHWVGGKRIVWSDVVNSDAG